jgi:hypothetical protein
MLTDEQITKLSAVQAKYADELMAFPNVVGVGIGFARKDHASTDEPAIVVMVSEKVPLAQLAPEDILPLELDGVRVDVQATGTFGAGGLIAGG